VSSLLKKDAMRSRNPQTVTATSLPRECITVEDSDNSQNDKSELLQTFLQICSISRSPLKAYAFQLKHESLVHSLSTSSLEAGKTALENQPSLTSRSSSLVIIAVVCNYSLIRKESRQK
jgi:hypothetical protein